MEGFDFQVEILRTKRKKSASIQLNEGLVKVLVPKSLSDKRIRDLILKRSSWIQTKLKEQSKRLPITPREYVSGECFPYLGKNYRLKVVYGENLSVKMKNGYLVVTLISDMDQQEVVRLQLEKWYQEHAETRLKEKTKRLAKIVGVNPSSVSVKTYKSRWGSCSHKGEIIYNWKIILAPHRIVDYVVVHELCHLLEHNHSPKYWRQVERHTPDWKNCRNWLKSNSVNLQNFFL
ncbi:M48 family metallopeptidase [Woeseiaceae bacterium]|nr:M48 family metallopeptidase [Woeseiaceae bacterium]